MALCLLADESRLQFDYELFARATLAGFVGPIADNRPHRL